MNKKRQILKQKEKRREYLNKINYIKRIHCKQNKNIHQKTEYNINRLRVCICIQSKSVVRFLGITKSFTFSSSIGAPPSPSGISCVRLCAITKSLITFGTEHGIIDGL